MLKTRRNLFIFIALLAIIGVGLFQRSYYIRTDGKYLLEIDTYYHYRMAQTILEQGARPAWDTMAYSPTGGPVDHPPLLHYYLAYSYKVVHLISPLTLYRWCIYANVIPIILAILAAYYAGKALTSEIGGLFTALFVAVGGAFSSRTIIGYTDTDIWIILFSFITTYFFFKTIREQKYWWPLLLGGSLFVFSLTWIGYWYAVLLVIGTFVMYLVVDAVRKKVDVTLLSLFALLLLSFTLPWSLYYKNYMTGGVLALLGVLLLFSERFKIGFRKVNVAALINVMIIAMGFIVLYDANVYSSVFSILHTALGVAPSSAGGGPVLPDISISVLQRYTVTLSVLLQLFSLLMVLAPFGIVFLLSKKDRFSLQALVYLGLYLVGTGMLLLMGGRYTMLFGVPLGLAGGAFFAMLPEMLTGRITSRGVAAAVIVCGLSVIPCYTGGQQITRLSGPMNDDMWELLTWTNENTPSDAVIISAWDVGYWIEAIAQRKTVMNGSHYDIAWRVVKFGKLVETQDETVAMKEVYGFSDRSEVEALRQFPPGSDSYIEKEMAGFAEDDAYVLVCEWNMLTFYWLTYYGNWDYVTGEGEHRLYDPMWLQESRKLTAATEYIYGTKNIGFSVIKENDNLHSYILGKNGYVPTMGTLFFKDNIPYYLRKEGGALGVVYVPPQSMPYFVAVLERPGMPAEVVFVRETELPCIMTRLYFFNGEGLTYFELVKDCRTAKLYKVHKIPQQFVQGVTTEQDTYTPT